MRFAAIVRMMSLSSRMGMLTVAVAVTLLPVAASAQSGDDDPGAGEPGRPGTSTVIRGADGSPGPSGAPGDVITPTPEPTAAPAGGGTSGSAATPAPAPRRTAKPAPTDAQIEVEQQSSSRSPTVPALAGLGLLAGAALLIWSWRRGVPG